MLMQPGLGGLQYTQPGGIRALTGRWDLTGPGQSDEASDQITGSGGNAMAETRQGNTFTYGDSEHTVKEVPDDNTIVLTSPWGGPSGKGVEVYVSGQLPAAKAAGRRPIYKSPVGIILILGVTGAAAYGGWWLYKRYKAKKKPFA